MFTLLKQLLNYAATSVWVLLSKEVVVSLNQSNKIKLKPEQR